MRRQRKRKEVEATPPKEVDINEKAKCLIARHGTEVVQTASFSYIVSLTEESIDLPIREEIARAVHKMVSYKGSWDQWVDSYLTTGILR